LHKIAEFDKFKHLAGLGLTGRSSQDERDHLAEGMDLFRKFRIFGSLRMAYKTLAKDGAL
jgi:hypothetical protein